MQEIMLPTLRIRMVNPNSPTGTRRMLVHKNLSVGINGQCCLSAGFAECNWHIAKAANMQRPLGL